MFKRAYNLIFSVALVIIICSWMPAFSDNNFAADTKKANKLYKGRKHDEALKIYSALLEKDPGSATANYNVGAALYAKGKFNDSIGYFIKALSTEDRFIEKNALFSIGNAYFRLSRVREKNDPAGAVALCVKATDYFKLAMGLDERDKRIKYNYEVTQAFLKKIERKYYAGRTPSLKERKKQRRQKDKERRSEDRNIE
ncbi:MAG: hypothetical protein HQ579_09390, partial [Candidatus Omnitrophica bacterium]|nr:hypothetical protein [Candidatus Omnitrophota bacterium]